MKKFYSLVLALTVFTISRSQTSVSFSAGKDNSIFSESGSRSNGKGENLITGTTNSGNNRRALIFFDLSSIPAGSTITSVTLSLYCNNVSGTGSSAGVVLHKVLNDWGEGTSNANGSEGTGAAATTGDATWSHRFFNTLTWAASGADYSSTISGSASNIPQTGPVAINNAGLITDVQGWVNNASSNFGWLIRGTSEGTAGTGRRFASRENVVAGQTTPRLTIEYTRGGAVPVTLKSFAVEIHNSNATLAWKTATEINNKYFDVEHSVNGSNFASIGTVAGNGNSTLERSYSFTHNNISAGKHYYRLAQHDVNGAVKYSQVILISTSAKNKLQINPNPATTIINLTGPSSLSGAQYIIRSSNGQVIKKGLLNDQQLNVGQLRSGLYQLQIELSEGEKLSGTFIKN